MSSISPGVSPPKTNPLLTPLLIASGLAIAEAVVVVILLVIIALQVSRRPVVSTPARVPQGAPQVAPPVTAESPRGKRGERVESAGFAITVENIVRKPPSDPLGQASGDRRYLALLLLVENNCGSSVNFFPTSFRLQDDQGYEYEPLAMKLIAPALDWRHLGNREKVRGYVDFSVPKSSKGFTLIYTNLTRPIQIELGE
jgi:hypothetical protein